MEGREQEWEEVDRGGVLEGEVEIEEIGIGEEVKESLRGLILSGSSARQTLLC